MLQPIDLDQSTIARQFDRRAAQFKENDYLLREVEARMFERLQLVKIAPEQIIDVGCGLGAGTARLRQIYPQAKVTGFDVSPKMIEQARRTYSPPASGFLAKLVKSVAQAASGEAQAKLSFEVGEAAQLPLAANSVDLIWSNLMLHWLGHPEAALQHLYQAAKPGALFMFSAFGVDTLTEVRPASRFMPFRDMHDWGDALVETGFAEPVMDMDRITLSFSSAEKLLTDLHRLGGNALSARAKALSPGSMKADMLRGLKAGKQAPYLLSFEVIFGHAWVPAKKKRSDGLVGVDFLPKRVDGPVSRPRS